MSQVAPWLALPGGAGQGPLASFASGRIIRDDDSLSADTLAFRP